MNKLTILANEGIFVMPEKEKAVPSLKVADSVISKFEELGVKVDEDVRNAFSISYKSYLDEVLDAFKESEEYATTLKLGNDSVLLSKLKRILLSDSVLSAFDMKALKYCLQETPELVKQAIPAYIPRKEIMAIIASYDIIIPVVSATDVLRLASYFSRMGTNLALNIRKFKGFSSFSITKRSYLLNLLEPVVDLNSMWKYKTYWMSFFDKVSILEYKTIFPKSYRTYKKLQELEMYNSYKQIEKAFSKSIYIGIKTFAKYPKLFERNLIQLLKDYPYMSDLILKEFVHAFYKFKLKDIMMLVNYVNKSSVLSEDLIYDNKNNLMYISADNVLSPRMHKSIKEAILSVIQKNSHSTIKLDTWIDPSLKYVAFPSNISDEAINTVTPLNNHRIPINSVNNKIIVWVAAKTNYITEPYCIMYNVDNNNIKKINMVFNKKEDGYAVFSLYLDMQKLAEKYNFIIFYTEAHESMNKLKARFGMIPGKATLIDINREYLNLTAHGKIVTTGLIDLESKEIVHLNTAAPNNILDKKYMDYVNTPPMISVYDIVKARINPSINGDDTQDKFKHSIMLEDINMTGWFKSMIA